MAKGTSPGARSRARELVVQALYQMQITDHDLAELQKQFTERPDYQRVDQDFFDSLIAAVVENRDVLEAGIAEFSDRPLAQLDPVERGILLLGYHEMAEVRDVPYRVVINESVNLARRFGASDGHKFINALLDRAAVKLRPEESG